MLNNFRILFIFCINIDIDDVLLLDINKGLGFIPIELFPLVILEKVFWFLLLIPLIFLNNSRNHFIFCINIDKMLLLDKNKGLGVSFFFVILEKQFWSLFLILLNNFRIVFIFCINLDFDKALLLHKKKSLGVNSFRVISLCNS